MSVLDREGLRQIIASLTGLSDFATFWAIDPNSGIGDQDRAQVSMDVLGMEALGVDEHRRFLSDGTDGYPVGTFWTLEIGNREIIITFRAEALDKGVEAAELIDAIRTGIRADAVTARLNAINLAFVWASKAMRVPNRVDTRALNTAVADFEFAGIAQKVSQIIPPGVGGDYIQTVDTTNLIPGVLVP